MNGRMPSNSNEIQTLIDKIVGGKYFPHLDDYKGDTKIIKGLEQEIRIVNNNIERVDDDIKEKDNKLQSGKASDPDKVKRNLKSLNDFKAVLVEYKSKLNSELAKFTKKSNNVNEYVKDLKLKVYESWDQGLLTDNEKNVMINFINESVTED